MTIDYYLADRQHRRVFDVGCHRHVFGRTLRRALEQPAPPTKHDFVLACAAQEYDAVVRYPASVEEKDPMAWAVWIGSCAERIWDFAEAAAWDVEVFTDHDEESLRDTAGWPTTGTIYSKEG